MSELDDALAKVRARADKAQIGKVGKEALLAGIRESLTSSLEPPFALQLDALRLLLGEDVLDAGAFLMGMQAAALAMMEMDVLSMLRDKDLNDLFREHVVKARELTAWRCSGCGSATGRYDGGPVCETCVTGSFAEGG